MQKLCQACEKEAGEKTCLQCGRYIGKKCLSNALCKDCKNIS